MCGIVAICSHSPVNQVLLDELDLLRYRGYDSAGYALLSNQGNLYIQHSTDREAIQALRSDSLTQPAAHIGIAHTRWATHGKAELTNAHPHYVNHTLALVHNGIIENHRQLKETLNQQSQGGISWRSDTDSEVIAQWLYAETDRTGSFTEALQNLHNALEGTYALAIIHKDFPETLFCLCKGSPLVIGKNDGGFHVASDLAAIDTTCTDYHDMQAETLYTIHQQNGIQSAASLDWQPIPKQAITALRDKGDFAHVTLEEIHSQPEILESIISQPERDQAVFEQLKPMLDSADNILLLGCGSSRYCGRSAKYWLEAIAQKPTQVELASEFTHRKPCLSKNTLVICISQSGETQDTIQALRYIQENHADKITLSLPKNGSSEKESVEGTVCLGNQPLSTLAKESTLFVPTYANKEIGVATTKVFTSQLLRLAQITCLANPEHPDAQNLRESLHTLPHALQQVLTLEDAIKNMPQTQSDSTQLIFLGKGILYPIAEETALKVQELAYVPAQAYATGELKHGPLALVDHNQTCFVLVNDDATFPLVESNIHEIAARNGQVVAVAAASTLAKMDPSLLTASIALPNANHAITPFTSIVAMQLYAYHHALYKGCEIDQPRNLAKSVTVL